MKQTLTRIAVALAVGVLLGGSALAATKSKNVRFDDEVTVNGTLLKKGTYKVAFDDQTNKLTISRNGKVVVETTAKLEDYKKTTAAYAPEYKTRLEKEGGARMLTSVNIGGAFAIIGGAGSATTGIQ
jgi:hypothetical protein